MIFGTFCVAAFIHVFIFFQESQGHSLEEMDVIFDRNKFAFGKTTGLEESLETRIQNVQKEQEACRT